jgi:outer membrane protein insertion porin family
MTPLLRNNFFLLLVFVLAVSCRGTKRLPVGEKLYTGASVQLVSPEKIKSKNKITTEAKTAIRPEPNKKFLGQRPKLWIYMVASDSTKHKKIKKLFKKYGEAPVLMSSVNPGQTSKFIDAKLFNIGIFKGVTEFKTIEKKHTARIVYICHVHNPYTIKKVKDLLHNTLLSKTINAEQSSTLLHSGDDYTLDNLQKELERIDIVLKDSGFYFFNPDYLLFRADTSEADKTVSLRLTLKDETPDRALRIYRINKVFIDPNYSLEKTDSIKKDTLMVDDVIFLNKRTKVKPKIILESVYLKKNDIYSRKKHNITLNRLMTVGIYKYVRIKFTEVDTSIVKRDSSGFLNMTIYLTPMPKRTLRVEGNLISKSNDFVGPQLNLSFRNRNEFKGAELLSLTLGTSFETQIAGKYKNLYSYSFNPQTELDFPRFIVPFKLKRTNSYYVPKTKFSLGFDYLKRIGYFDMKSLHFIYGFKWKENAKIERELDPVNISYTSVSNKSPDFLTLLASNPFIKKSYEEQFIAGSTYSYTYNEQILPNKKNQVYFNLTSEIAGNSLTLAELIAGQKPTEENPLHIGGSTYSQFAKISIDARNYLNFKSSKIAVRLFAGVGKPYGNSSTLPYIKQYFSGGPNSVRAFLINSLGPGTYQQQTKDGSLFIQQGGDVKLETNLEYRFNIFSYFKGAIFTDAGNIWLLKSDPAALSSPFAFSNFYKEIAIGSGIGLRVDVNFFVLRFDLATPLRKPWLAEGEQWVINKINFGSSSWRSDNLILNVAIGYPF